MGCLDRGRASARRWLAMPREQYKGLGVEAGEEGTTEAGDWMAWPEGSVFDLCDGKPRASGVKGGRNQE